MALFLITTSLLTRNKLVSSPLKNNEYGGVIFTTSNDRKINVLEPIFLYYVSFLQYWKVCPFYNHAFHRCGVVTGIATPSKRAIFLERIHVRSNLKK